MRMCETVYTTAITDVFGPMAILMLKFVLTVESIDDMAHVRLVVGTTAFIQSRTDPPWIDPP
jgi:hypothetical protein